MNFKEYHGYKVWDNGVVIGRDGLPLITNITKKGYLRVNTNPPARIHALVANLFLPNFYGLPTVEHKDRDRTNNSLYNLKWATYREQCINQGVRFDNSSGIKGVCWLKRRRRWCAFISPTIGKRKEKHFKSKEDAIAQRKAWELEYYNLI